VIVTVVGVDEHFGFGGEVGFGLAEASDGGGEEAFAEADFQSLRQGAVTEILRTVGSASMNGNDENPTLPRSR